MPEQGPPDLANSSHVDSFQIGFQLDTIFGEPDTVMTLAGDVLTSPDHVIKKKKKEEKIKLNKHIEYQGMWIRHGGRIRGACRLVADDMQHMTASFDPHA